MKLSRSSVVYGAAVTTVVVAVAAGLRVLGPPAEERARRMDDRRMTDLHTIAAATDLYWTRHARLPQSLEELAAEPGVTISSSDPASAERYDYRALGSATYEVCASFARASPPTSRGGADISPIFRQSCQLCHGPGSVPQSEGDEPIPAHAARRDLWAHESGRQCFQLKAEAMARNEG